jgi:hypothetical protein
MVSAKDVPALVAAHQDYLRGARYASFAGSFMRSMYAKTINGDTYEEAAKLTGTTMADVARGVGVRFCRDEHEMLYDVPLYHVTDSMVEVAKYAAEKLDDLDRWEDQTLPSMTGFLVFEKPLRLTDVWGRPMGVAAVSWRREVDPKGRASYVSHETDELGDDRMVTTLMFYSDTGDMQDFYSREIAADPSTHESDSYLGRWAPMHYDGFPDGMRIGPFTMEASAEKMQEYRRRNADADRELRAESAEFAAVHRKLHPELYDAEDEHLLDESDPLPERIEQSLNLSRMLYAIFALMEQSVVAKSTYTDKRMARRNRHKRRTPPMVIVITLRRAEDFGYYEEGTGQWLTYRSIVKAHWRRQHYKDGSVRRIYIARYWRGPEEAPIHQPKRVSSLSR